VTDVLGALALFLLITAGGTLALRRSRSPSRYRPAAGARYRRAPARERESWLVTAAKAAGVPVKSDHLHGATAELTGKTAGQSVRATGRLARWAGRHAGRAGRAVGRRAEAGAARRWQARSQADKTPLLWWHRNRGGRCERCGGPGAGEVTWAGSSVTERLCRTCLDTQEAANQAASQAAGRGQASAPNPAASPAAGTPPPAPAGAPTVPARGQKEVRLMRQRYSINLEPPGTDAEFLESCVQLGDVLKALAEEVSNWADGLSSLHLPPSVLSPLNNLCEGIEEAATGAAEAAKAFEDEFEDARDVASRGMHFTGQDAA
jgi:hypothetical protein